VNVTVTFNEERFGLTEGQQSCINSYQSQQSNYNTYQAYANMLAKTLKNSVDAIRTWFPINLTSRSTAYLIYSNAALSCEGFMTQATVDATQTAAICAKFNFTDIDDVQFFVRGK